MKTIIYNPKKQMLAVLLDGKLQVGYSGLIAERKLFENLCSGAEIQIINQNIKLPVNDTQLAIQQLVNEGLKNMPPMPVFTCELNFKNKR